MGDEMNGMLLDTNQIHPVSDFIRNHKTYIARLKETHSPEVLTVNGRAEVVMLDAETYQNLVNTFRDMEAIADARAKFDRIKAHSQYEEPFTEEDIERSRAAMMKLVEETERQGLYK
jgi:PHD/YefM family antitoxin component YafN of YafNO toxin-antitoxin module